MNEHVIFHGTDEDEVEKEAGLRPHRSSGCIRSAIIAAAAGERAEPGPAIICIVKLASFSFRDLPRLRAASILFSRVAYA